MTARHGTRPDARRRGLLAGGFGSLALVGLSGGDAHAETCTAAPARLATVRPGVRIAYEDDYFGAPWVTPDTIVLMHGVGEGARAWQQWVGPLAAEFRVIRPEMPGFGRSPTPDTYSWSPREIAADIGALLTSLGIPRFHLVGAKYGGTVCLQLAADQPDRLLSLAVYGTPVKGAGTGGKADLTSFPALIQRMGVRAWSAQSQPARLGHEASQAQLDWWTDSLMAPADPRALIGATSAVAVANVEDRLAAITAPSLVVTTADSPLQPVASARAYQERIPHSRLLVLPGDSYHVAAVHPKECAQAELDFIHSLPKSG